MDAGWFVAEPDIPWYLIDNSVFTEIPSLNQDPARNQPEGDGKLLPASGHP
jgi:hypothetical protein